MKTIAEILGLSRAPKSYVSAYSPLYKALVAALKRPGVHVGGTAGYPRVEVNSITEQEWLDKEGQVRRLHCIVESISDRSVAECNGMNETNLSVLTGSAGIAPEGWEVIGIVPVQLQDLTETSNTDKIIYRLLQEMDIYMKLIKE